MGKTYLETIKYMIVADFEVQGLVERPDVIGAIFGQSEGLLGSQLDIKELQQNGKIGRIEITVNHSNNKTTGSLKLPCSLSMVETAIIAAAIETIDKVGPCDTFFVIKQIEDTRGLKRKQIKERAIELLGKVMQEEIPDTKELMDEISETFKTKDIILYGPDKLPAGPTIGSSKEIIVVEGRADVINMLRYGFTNVISTGGARIPRTLADICKSKIVTLFLDGDHGGEIQQSQLLKAIKVDFVARAPDGKEVEELTQKEINQALRKKVKPSFVDSSYKPRPLNTTPVPGIGEVNNAVPNLVRQTKFSTTNTNDQKFNKPAYVPRREEPSMPGESIPEPISPSEYEHHEYKPRYEHNDAPRYAPKDDFKKNEFDSMLSSIPNVERVDAAPRESRGFNSRDRPQGGNHYSRDRDSSSQGRDRNSSYPPRDRDNGFRRNDRDSFKRDERPPFKREEHDSFRREEHDSFKREEHDSFKRDEPKNDHIFHKEINMREKPKLNEDIVSLPKDVNEFTSIEHESNKQFIEPKKITDFVPSKRIIETTTFDDFTVKQEPIVESTTSKPEVEKKEVIKPKKVEPKKIVVLPKLTDKIKESLLEIVNEGENKGSARILNEKFRRIGSAKNEDLLSKLEGFKANKIYAIVTDTPLTSELIEVSKEKGVMFLICPSSTIKEDKEINIVTFQDLKK